MYGPSDGDHHERAANDAMLLVVYYGPSEDTAEDLGWITLQDEGSDDPAHEIKRLKSRVNALRGICDTAAGYLLDR